MSSSPNPHLLSVSFHPPLDDYFVDVDNVTYEPDDVAYQKFDLIRYRKKKIPKKTYKLLETFSKKDTEESIEPERVLALPS